MSATSGVGQPAGLYLEQFGRVLYEAFGTPAYHVGSSMPGKGPGWRDVDVRLMLDDEVYEAMGFGDPKRPHDNARWVAFTLAFTALGRQMTGLPIDFQIQQTSRANEVEGNAARNAIGIRSSLHEYRDVPPLPGTVEVAP